MYLKWKILHIMISSTILRLITNINNHFALSDYLTPVAKSEMDRLWRGGSMKDGPNREKLY
jgi:hypothetical protein